MSLAVTTDLIGQVAVVTGAGRGIGRAIALAYGGAGATVVCAARTVAEIEAVAGEVEAAGGRALAVPTDVADRTQVQALVDRTVAATGRLDIVVANAGVGGFGDVDDPVAAFRMVLEVNLVSVYALVRAALPALRDPAGKREPGGKVILMGSGAGYRPFPGAAAYSCSKAGAAMLVRVLAAELRNDAVAVNEIVPGPVATKLAGEAIDLDRLPAAVRSEWRKQPEDVAPLALYLAGLPNAGPTGQRFSLLGRDG
jgi:3-oxoacyl-[acyl-carrier protein] reductase